MQLATIIARLDAQEQRLAKHIDKGSALPVDLSFKTHDGRVLVPFDDTPDEAQRISIVIIPTSKFLTLSDEQVVNEYRAVPTEETYLVETGWYDAIEVTRNRLLITPVLADAPEGYALPKVEVTEHATGGDATRHVSKPRLVTVDGERVAEPMPRGTWGEYLRGKREKEEEIVPPIERKPFTSVDAWVQDQLAAFKNIR